MVLEQELSILNIQPGGEGVENSGSNYQVLRTVVHVRVSLCPSLPPGSSLFRHPLD